MSLLDKFNNIRTKYYKIEFALIILFLFALVLFFSKPAVVGYASTSTHNNNLNILIKNSQEFNLQTLDDSDIILKSLRISGEINGPGLVSAYLISSQNQKYLLFHNIKKGFGSNRITANIVGSEATTSSLLPKKGPVLKLVTGEKINEFQRPKEIYETFNGFFEKTCFETCFFDDFQFHGTKFKLIFSIEPRTSLTINDLSYTTFKE